MSLLLHMKDILLETEYYMTNTNKFLHCFQVIYYIVYHKNRYILGVDTVGNVFLQIIKLL